MSSKRKSPPTKLEGGCQPTQTTSVPLVTGSSDSNISKFHRNSNDTICIEKDYSRVDVSNDKIDNGLLQSIDVAVNSDDDDEYCSANDNNDNEEQLHQQQQQQNCKYNGESMVNINGSENKSIDDSDSDNSNECAQNTTPVKDEIDFDADAVDLCDDNKSADDGACDDADADHDDNDDCVTNTNRRNSVNNNIYNKHINDDKKHCQQLIDEHNNNSDYDEPCKRMKINRSPILPVRCTQLHTLTHFTLNPLILILTQCATTFETFYIKQTKKKNYSYMYERHDAARHSTRSSAIFGNNFFFVSFTLLRLCAE